jgi:hypothetical protein
MSGVMIHKSPQGAVVIKRGFGFVTASALMPYREEAGGGIKQG